MASLVARGGLLDRNRRERETSTWLSEGDGVGDLEAGVAGADWAVVVGGQVSIATRYELLACIPPNIRDDGWMATGDERERCMDIIMGP
jgi:hypothetical protein